MDKNGRTASFDCLGDLQRFCKSIDDTIRKKLNQGPCDISSILSSQSEERIHQILRSSEPVVNSISADLVIQIENDLSALTLRTEGTELRVQDPVGVWVCCCDDPTEGNCPLHSHPDGSNLFDALTNGTVRAHYDGIDLWWMVTPSLFPLSRDPIYAYENLLTDGISTAEITSVIDIGCGTGFLGTSIAASNPNVETVCFGDQLLTPVVISKLNHQWNHDAKSCYPALTDGFTPRIGQCPWKKQPADVCICNPPYLPAVDGEAEPVFNPGFIDSGLLKEVIRQGDEIANRVYLHISDLARREVAEVAAERDAELQIVGEKRTVPFRLTAALESPVYLEQLLDRGLQERHTDEYRYWHTLATYRINY